MAIRRKGHGDGAGAWPAAVFDAEAAIWVPGTGDGGVGGYFVVDDAGLGMVACGADRFGVPPVMPRSVRLYAFWTLVRGVTLLQPSPEQVATS